MARRTARFLRERMQSSASAIDLISLIFGARLLEASTGVDVFAATHAGWPRATADVLEQLRRPDGGYAKSAEGHVSSTYQTFLVALTYQLLELPLPDAGGASDFILGQQREDGGFVEIRAMRRSGTNPTAAAVGTLRVLQSQVEQELLTPTKRNAVARFLAGARTDEGGLRANTQIPIADLLSTFTGLQTIRDLDAWNQIDTDAVLRYVRSLEQAQGGFLAAAWDDAVDVEYSFYGVASLGLLLSPAL